MPAEVAVEEGRIRLSRKRLTPDQLVALILGECHDTMPTA
jgi:hypothetical protein